MSIGMKTGMNTGTSSVTNIAKNATSAKSAASRLHARSIQHRRSSDIPRVSIQHIKNSNYTTTLITAIRAISEGTSNNISEIHTTE